MTGVAYKLEFPSQIEAWPKKKLDRQISTKLASNTMDRININVSWMAFALYFIVEHGMMDRRAARTDDTTNGAQCTLDRSCSRVLANGFFSGLSTGWSW